MRRKPDEVGSDFHWPTGGSEEPQRYPWGDAVALFGSGRDAMRGLFSWGAREHGWRRALLPSYYCQDVPAALAELRALGLTLEPYADAPDRAEPDLAALRVGAGDVIVVVNYFGLRDRPAALDDVLGRSATIVEDHTHDLAGPWALRSNAHYAVASLRKTLPVPDGGAVWSPRGLALPAERTLTAEHARATLDRLSAMTLKARFLDGLAVEKDAFRACALAGEEHIADGEASGISPLSRAMLPSLPFGEWRAQRGANFASLSRALGALRGVRILSPSLAPGIVPYALTLHFDTAALRDTVKAALVASRVYPAVLWSLEDPKIDGIPASDVDLARRMLSIHCDHRYGPAAIERVAALLVSLVGA